MEIKLISADVSKYEAFFKVLENGIEKEIYCEYEVSLDVSYCDGDYWTPPCRDIEGFEVYVSDVAIDGDCTKNKLYYDFVQKQLDNHVEANLTNYDN